MLEWCMAHPWMTFIIAIFALDVIGTIINNVIKLVHNAIITMEAYRYSRKTR